MSKTFNLHNKDNYIFDLDGTICEEKPKGTSREEYINVKPKKDVVRVIHKLKDMGKTITILTARHMATTSGDVDAVEDLIGGITEKWLEDNNIPYDFLYYGKPYGIVQVDDRSIHPAELVALNRMGELENIDTYLSQKDLAKRVNSALSFCMNNYYVYQWFYIEEDVKIVFYIGKGKNLRAFDTVRNETFDNIYNSKKCFVEIVKMFETNEEAIDFERVLKYSNKDIKQAEGSLDDNRGKNLHKRTKKEKEKPLIDKRTLPRSEETRQKISKTKKLKGSSAGLRNSNCKVTEKILEKICNDFNNGYRPIDIFKSYDISLSTLNRIYYGMAHKEITEKYLEEGYGYKK